VDHIEAWIFDLDNTLYPATADVFPQIDKRMKAFIGELLKLSPEDAFKLQKEYYWKYGTTLRGLMINHKIAPDEFLEYVHDIDHTPLVHNAELDVILAALPGRKFIYTNGSERHATNVLDRLGVTRHFDGIFDIRASDYIPKPDPVPYSILVKRHTIAPTRAIMFEDIHRNLKPAADLGMETVWVLGGEHIPKADEDLSHCRYTTDDLLGWLAEKTPKAKPRGG
jgi:putative hydrolase of the HAD superfamily